MIINGQESRPANAEMIEGFRDGYDLLTPEPSHNRSASYRHGFMCARIDKRMIDCKGSPADLRRLAEEAMEADHHSSTWSTGSEN